MGGALSLSLPIVFTTSCAKTVTLYDLKVGDNLKGKTLSFPTITDGMYFGRSLSEELIFENGYHIELYNTGTGTGDFDFNIWNGSQFVEGFYNGSDKEWLETSYTFPDYDFIITEIDRSEIIP
jgi:hypothetical protein